MSETSRIRTSAKVGGASPDYDSNSKISNSKMRPASAGEQPYSANLPSSLATNQDTRHKAADASILGRHRQRDRLARPIALVCVGRYKATDCNAPTSRAFCRPTGRGSGLCCLD